MLRHVRKSCRYVPVQVDPQQQPEPSDTRPATPSVVTNITNCHGVNISINVNINVTAKQPAPTQRPFRDPNMDYITHEELMGIIRKEDLYTAQQDLIVRVFFDADHVENSNIHGGPPGEPYGFFFDRADGQWHVAGIRWIGSVVAKDIASFMSQFFSDNVEKLSAKQIAKFERFEVNINCLESIILDTIKTLRENSDAVLDRHPNAKELGELLERPQPKEIDRYFCPPPRNPRRYAA